MKTAIKQLLCVFDDEHGVPYYGFNATYFLIQKQFGKELADLFSHSIKAVEERYFISHESRMILVEKMNEKN